VRGRSILSTLWRWGPFLVYAGLISYLSSEPSLKPPFNIWDKLAHAVEFGILAALLWRAIGGSFLASATPRRAALYLAACALYAGLDEYHQSFVPGRDSSLLDVLADVTGASIIVAGLSAISWWRTRPRPPGAAPPAKMRALTLLSKPGCHLCDEAEAVILEVRSEIPFAYERVDVSGDAELSSRYGLELPVVLMGGRKIFKHRVDPEKLRRRLLYGSREVAG
jgi:VanZ family protein